MENSNVDSYCGLVYHHFFAKSHHRASKNQPRKKNHPPPRQCKLAHSPRNKAVFNGRKRGILGPSSIIVPI
ncbi:unnamed protein product [Acanthoscelides obtectus]|uniref:Uncharacterized protein n=1 Tax=Acanthoscelides obtectus TaxID=200917 RepID=A0A9P0PYM8_ACAOB|nr:unnamed protein product [Acanthoscelides obtectus]CAK1623232.1 hypothetical protein AOBTE_LOCUS1896 [Acanthoscelides obtectus]